MICVCGGRTLTANARQPNAVLYWQQCGACERCEDYSLTVHRKKVASGQPARLAFQDERLLEIIRQRYLGRNTSKNQME
jgi:hypothetical protein